MGLFNDFVNHMAGIAGESLRISKAQKKTYTMDAETQAYYNKMLQAAENGNVKAIFQLGLWYYQGTKIAYDPDKACYWWTKAANMGDVDAQYNLGLMYHGQTSPVSFDEEKAGYWFNRAANNGDANAQKMLNKWYEYDKKRGKWCKLYEPRG